jgi:hypothetical protein
MSIDQAIAFVEALTGHESLPTGTARKPKSPHALTAISLLVGQNQIPDAQRITAYMQGSRVNGYPGAITSFVKTLRAAANALEKVVPQEDKRVP